MSEIGPRMVLLLRELLAENRHLMDQVAELERLLEQARSIAATLALETCEGPWQD